MPLVRRIARPLLASTLVYGGLDAFRAPEPKAPAADKVVDGLAEKVPGISSTRQLVQVDGAIKVVAGTLLALGRFPRFSSLALIASMVPTTLAGHRPWEIDDPAQRKAQTLHLLKNASITGGLMLAAVDTHGKPSVTWRARRALRRAGETVSDRTSDLVDRVSS